jgi:hypothetical protein
MSFSARMMLPVADAGNHFQHYTTVTTMSHVDPYLMEIVQNVALVIVVPLILLISPH